MVDQVVRMLGVPICKLGTTEVMNKIVERIEHRTTPASFIVQITAYCLVTAQEKPEYCSALQAADLCLPDGKAITWLLRVKGVLQPPHIRGTDLMLSMCQMAESRKWRCFLYGGKDGVPEKLKQNLLILSLIHI